MTRAEKDEEREKSASRCGSSSIPTALKSKRGDGAYIWTTRWTSRSKHAVSPSKESPLEEGETVRVVGMSPTDPTLSQMFVTIEWMDRTLGVPLEQLEPIEASSKTDQAIADWQYWLDR